MPSKKKKLKSHRKAQPTVSLLNFRAARAAQLDRLADAELQQGFHSVAERLSRQAAEMREVGQ